jgi:hypothetical protein
MATVAVAAAVFEAAALEAAAPEIPDPRDDGADRAADGAEDHRMACGGRRGGGRRVRGGVR